MGLGKGKIGDMPGGETPSKSHWPDKGAMRAGDCEIVVAVGVAGTVEEGRGTLETLCYTMKMKTNAIELS